ARFHRGFEAQFERLRGGYRNLLSVLIARRFVFIPGFLIACLSTFLLLPWLGEDFFPQTDNGAMILHIRAKTGTRIEETARLRAPLQTSTLGRIPAQELDNIVDNIGLPYSTINTIYSTSGLIGAADANILISLKANHRPTADYVRQLRLDLPREFPGVMMYFLPADMITQVLNFGLPAPVEVEIEGADVNANRQLADRILDQLRTVPGLVDLRVQQPFDYPNFTVAVDRTKAEQAGLTERDVATSMLNTLSGSGQVTPTFFLNWTNGVNYNLVAMTPQYDIQSLQDLQNIPITGAGMTRPAILADVASITRGDEMAILSHYNVRRVVDIYGTPQDRDLGAVGRDVIRIVDANKKYLARGSFIVVRGQLQTMLSSFVSLGAGLAFSILLVYLVIVVNFQPWLDPFIIITALPAALAGIDLFLFVTHTTLSVPALMGAIMCMGVATANSILVVAFAK